MRTLKKSQIVTALRRAGLEKGDTVMFHSSLKGLGKIAGGPRSVISALKAVVGKNGTIVMPVFTYSSVERPFDHKRSKARTGAIPEYFRHQRQVYRSKGPTHSVAVWGRRARYIAAGHGAVPPYDKKSPFGKLYRYNGKIVFFGCRMYANSMLHAAEDWYGAPYLESGRVGIMQGGRKIIRTYKKLPPGHRDFYQQSDTYTAKIYREFYKQGLVREVKTGKGYIRMIPVREMMDACETIFREKPDILLCDRKDCAFCSRTRRQMKK